MTMNRRAFLATATLLGAGALGGPPVATADAAAPVSAGRLSRATFTPLLGRSLSAAGQGRRVRLRLERVDDVLGAPARSPDRFLLQFVSPKPLPDGVYTISGDRFEEQELFLSAVFHAADRRYEAVVNQWAPGR